MLTLIFAPFTFIHLGKTCKYIWPNTIFHLYQTQFNHSSKPVCILVEHNWGQRVCSYFLVVFHIISWVLKFVILSFCLYIYDILVISITEFIYSLLLISPFNKYIYCKIRQAILVSPCFSLLWMRPDTLIISLLDVFIHPSDFAS